MKFRIVLSFLAIVLISVGLHSCIEINNKFNALPPGPWRVVFKLPSESTPAIETIETDEYQITKNYSELPFIMNVNYVSDDKFQLEIVNGDEKIILDDIEYGVDRATAKDTLVVHFPAYDTYLKGIYEEKFIEGQWVVNYKDNYSIPFIAFYGQKDRFTKAEPAKVDLNGEWFCEFDYDKDDLYPAIAVFKQVGDKLTGTFKTETGDYRYLEGHVHGQKFELSVFDGAHAFLFSGKQTADGELTGLFRSGKHYSSNWKAKKKTDESTLTSPYNLSKATTSESIDFSFKNAKGETVNLTDPVYANKPKLINIMGTWCPNCRDEINFLKNHLDKIQENDIEIISLCFERYKDEAKNLASLKRYQEKLDVPWQMLLGGYFNKSEATEKVPFIDKVISYPTLIFLNSDNTIQKIHTGFNGPATSEYPAFEKEFLELINTLN